MARKVADRPAQRMARLLQKSEGIKYTAALRRVEAFLAAKKEKEADAIAAVANAPESDTDSE